MPKVTDDLIHALGRKRGEANISVLELSRQTGVSRWTLDKILRGDSSTVYTTTLDKLNKWLYQRI